MHAITDTIHEFVIDPFTPKRIESPAPNPRRALRYQVAKMLGNILDLLSLSASLAQVLDYIVAQTEPLLGATAAAIYRLEDNDDRLVLQSSCGLPPGFTTFATMSLADKPVVKQALTANQPVVIPTLVRDPLAVDSTSQPCRAMLFASGCYTLIIVPIMVDEERYGALFLYFVDQFEFDEAELALATTFGRKAACGIESALAWQANDQATHVAPKKRSRIIGNQWCNDAAADAIEPNVFGRENSILIA